MLTCVGKSIQYLWDGVSLKHSKGDDFGNISWDGAQLVLSKEGKDVVFCWNQGSTEFRSKPDSNGDSSVVWSWTKERFLQFLPLAPDDEKPAVWKFLRPVPPPIAMCVEIFSCLFAGKELIPVIEKKGIENVSAQERLKNRNIRKSEKASRIKQNDKKKGKKSKGGKDKKDKTDKKDKEEDVKEEKKEDPEEEKEKEKEKEDDSKDDTESADNKNQDDKEKSDNKDDGNASEATGEESAEVKKEESKEEVDDDDEEE